MNWGFVAKGLLVFSAYALLDVLYAVYTSAVVKYQAHLAAICTAIIYALSVFGVQLYMQDARFIIPLTLGAWAGTYFTVLFLKARNEKTRSLEKRD